MAARKQQAERALWAVGGGQETGGFSGSSSIVAEPAPRNADGSWPAESCIRLRGRTGGCITPRTAHAREQAQAAGFTHYVSCYRANNDGGEHPKGRACDFAAARAASAAPRVGDDARTATTSPRSSSSTPSRLGVLYVIWYRQIWLPGSGWRAYSGCCGPSAEHTNHVHLSRLLTHPAPSALQALTYACRRNGQLDAVPIGDLCGAPWRRRPVSCVAGQAAKAGGCRCRR